MTAGTAENPKGTPTYRVLKAVVIILGVLIVLAFVALIVGAVMKLSGRHNTAQAAGQSAAIIAALPPGARIMSLQTSGERIVVSVHAPSGDEVDIFDGETGRLVARITQAQRGPLR